MLNTERQLTPSWSLVRPSLELVKQNPEAVLIIALLPALLTDLASLALNTHNLTGLIVLAVAFLWRLINVPVSYYLQIGAIQKQPVTVSDCYRRGLPFWPNVIAFEIFFAIITIVGLILLIVPGLIIFRRYYLTPFYIVSGHASIGAAMRASADQTKPVSGWVWGTFGVMFAFGVLAVILSAAIPIVGVILAAFVSLIYFFGPALRWHEISRSDDKK